MLVLERKIGQEIVVPTCQVTVKVLEIEGSKVSFGVSAPADVPVHREEIWNRIHNQISPSGEQSSIRARVLLADPNQYLLAQYRSYLEHCGFEVATAVNGLECLENLRSFHPDVLVLEPVMPWGGGDGVLAVMHEARDVPSISVIVLTHGCDAGTLYNLAPFGIDDYHLKPLPPKKLSERIRTLIVQRRTQRARVAKSAPE
jgi:carbon storage regulator CsrA